MPFLGFTQAVTTDQLADPLQSIASFTASDIKDNRAGRLSDRQAAKLDGEVRALATLAAVLLGAAVLDLVLVISRRAPLPILILDISLGWFAWMALMVSSRRLADFRERRAVSYVGRLLKQVEPDTSAPGRVRHLLRIGEDGRRLTLIVPAQIFGSMPEAGHYRVFLAEHSRARLSVEVTPPSSASLDTEPPQPDETQEVYWC